MQWLIEEREALPVRRELDGVLTAIVTETGEHYELLGRQAEGPDALSARFSKDPYRRLPETSLGDAVTEVVELISGYPTGPWLVRPGRPERLGLVRLRAAPSAELLRVLASWDGEGLLFGPESDSGWILLDVEGQGDSARAEVFVSGPWDAHEPRPSRGA